MEYHFRDKNKTFPGIVLVFILVILLSAIVYVAAWMGIDGQLGTGLQTSALLAGIPTAVIAALLFALLLRGPDYRITETELQFIKKDKIIKKFSFRDHQISPLLTKVSINGVPSGTIRKIVVNNGNKESIHGINLSKSDYAKFIDLIVCHSSAK